MKFNLKKTVVVSAPFIALMAGCGGGGSNSGNHVNGSNKYVQTNLVANKAIYHPQILEPGLQDAWGVSLRPAGAGGHWWVAANKTGKSYEYVGDVNGKPLSVDPALPTVTVYDHDKAQGSPSGQVFNSTGTGFKITQTLPDGGTVTAPAKFIFANDDGTVNAWTQRNNADGTISYPVDANIVFDASQSGSGFFGVAISPTFDRLYLADFGSSPKVVVLNDQFQDISAGKFPNPFPGYAPFNCQNVGSSIFVAYAKQEEPTEELHGVGLGKLAEFDVNGALIATWDDRNLLNAPWGITKAPDSGFGLYSGKILVANFGNGTVTVFDPATRKAIDYIRTADGKPMVIDGIWDLKFGNGVSLGEANAMYFSAGPNSETDGIFGKIKAE